MEGRRGGGGAGGQRDETNTEMINRILQMRSQRDRSRSEESDVWDCEFDILPAQD